MTKEMLQRNYGSNPQLRLLMKSNDSADAVGVR